MDYRELKEKADTARKAKNWKDTLKYYSLIAELERVDTWDRYFFALALYKNNFVDKAIKICREIYKNKPLFLPNNSLYALNIERKVLYKIDYNDKNNVLKAINAVKKLIPENDKFLSFEQVIYKTLKRIEDSRHYSFLLWILDNLSLEKQDYEKLKEYDSKKNKYPSFVETHFVMRIRVNFALKKFDDTIKFVDSALQIVKRFFYNNHIWIRRLKALSYAEIGKEIMALREFFFIMRYKKDWFILYEVSQILLKIDMTEVAEYFALEALLDSQEPKYKIKLYEFFIEKGGNIIPLDIVISLLKLIYQNYKMSIPLRLQKLFENNKNTNLSSIKQLDNKVKRIAKKYLFGNKHDGVVIRVFNKFSGLLKAEKKIFFYTLQNTDREVAENDKVFFVETWNFDAKKNEIKKSALILR